MSTKAVRIKRQQPIVAPNPDLKAQLKEYFSELKEPPRTFSRGQIVTGKIVAMGSSEIIVDVGGRAEGVVAGREINLDGDTTIKNVGDDVLVYVIKGENEKGQIELSIRRTGSARKWHDLKLAQEADTSLKVKAMEANTGGLIVDVGGGLRGFIPTSQLDSARIFTGSSVYSDKQQATQDLQNKLAELINQEIEVKIIEIDRDKNRVIFSEKMVTSGANAELRQNTLSKANTGDVLEAEVTGIAPFGLFVNAQGLEGLVHLSEISWDKVSNPADFYHVGDKVKVQIIGIQDEGKRVAYSIKRLQSDPWDRLVEGYEVGQIVTGTVTKLVDYGAFARIGDGLNGLIHISEMSEKLVKDPADIVKLGEEVQVMIISISREDRHLGLSLKRIRKSGSDSKKGAAESDFKKEDNRAISPEMESLKSILGEE